MTRRIQIEQILLWLFVILSGIVIGGGLYEMRVIVPLWANSPPESAWYWEAQRIANPQYAPNSGLRFWIFLTPTHLLLSLATLIAGWKTLGDHRKWLFASTIAFIVLHTSALVWFVPTIGEILNSRSLGISPEQVTAKVHMWVTFSWVRAAIGLAAFVAGLRALTIPPLRE
ncbi:MAG: hypothetical protein AUG51_07085 [Acidobacteria bacterium 13_1_20CM_3_53_8]|nr:MAG: hypothetical protein AUG51_07085 [Acidobacteria bacterium 13_1_20CM_3_53_8]